MRVFIIYVLVRSLLSHKNNLFDKFFQKIGFDTLKYKNSYKKIIII